MKLVLVCSRLGIAWRFGSGVVPVFLQPTSAELVLGLDAELLDVERWDFILASNAFMIGVEGEESG